MQEAWKVFTRKPWKTNDPFHCLGFAFFCSAALYLSCQGNEGFALPRGTSVLCESKQAHLPPRLPSAAAPRCAVSPEHQETVSQSGQFPSREKRHDGKTATLGKEIVRLLACTKPAAWGKLSRNHHGLAAVSKVTSIFCDPGEAQPLQAHRQNTNSGSEVENKMHTKCHVLPQLLC